MASKKLFSWSKSRRSTSEPYHRTGGLLAIDTTLGQTESKEAISAWETASKKCPPNLRIVPPPSHHAALIHSPSGSSLATFSDVLGSPTTHSTHPKSASIYKPLPSRPRSPSTPDLPELPGSTLLESPDPPFRPIAGRAISQGTSHAFPRDSPALGNYDWSNSGPVDPFDLWPDSASPLTPTTRRNSAVRAARSSHCLSSSTAILPRPSKALQHKRSLSETSMHTASRWRPSLITSPSSTDDRITTCSLSTAEGRSSSNDLTAPRVGKERRRRYKGETTNRREEKTPSTASTPTPASTQSEQQSIASLRAAHEAHVASLKDAHAAEVATHQNYIRALEQQARSPDQASSSHLLLLLDTAEPQSPIQPGTASAASYPASRAARHLPPVRGRESLDMENLKRKLGSAKEPEINNVNIVRDNNQLKQNNVALQKQIESLMARLNQSRKNERNLTKTLEHTEKKCTEWQTKANKAEQLEKSTLALQNTVDSLEYRLEISNMEKCDAQEMLHHAQSRTTPFDLPSPKLQLPPVNDPACAHLSMSTVFSSGSSTSQNQEPQERTTLAAFISHIERLQEQIRDKDGLIAQLDSETKKLQTSHSRLQTEHKELNLESDIQRQLLKKTKETDAHIDQLRTVIMDREATIGEKDKALRVAERQLEHHKALLRAEIRKHASVKLFTSVDDDPLPDVKSLATKEDIDRWIERLQDRLKKEKMKTNEHVADGDTANIVTDLRKEIDFYVHEIIYYKLDVKGYKSDIKKLKQMATRMGKYESRASDFDLPTPSLSRSGDTPTHARFSVVSSAMEASDTSSPVYTGPSISASTVRPMTPHTDVPETIVKDSKQPGHKTPIMPQTPPRKAGKNPANEADQIDPGISPRSVAILSPERRKPTPPSPNQERFGDLATNFPLSTPAAPKRKRCRSLSDSIIELYAQSKTPEHASTSNQYGKETVAKTAQNRERSNSVPGANTGRLTPERLRRPLFGLHENSHAANCANMTDIPRPPRTNVLAEAMRNSPEQTSRAQPLNDERGFSVSTEPSIQASSTTYINEHSSSSMALLGNSVSSPPPPRPRAGSAGSTMAGINAQSQSWGLSSIGKISSDFGSNIPFVIGMGSPHNPALIAPTAAIPPTACSITGKHAPLRGATSTSKTGLGGTMASSAPMTSNLPQAEAVSSRPDTFKLRSVSNPIPSYSRNENVMEKEHHNPSSCEHPEAASATISGEHSHNTSGSSTKSVMHLSGNLAKGKSKTKKDVFDLPKPLTDNFEIVKPLSKGDVYIGRAM